jgi:hypothetical protein
MSPSPVIKRCFFKQAVPASVAACFVLLASVQAGDLNPKALFYKKPDQIKWVEKSPNGPIQAVLLGDPNKAGLYIILVKWLPHRMSHPHFHPNDRFATVISGTWYVGTGPKFDPDGTTPLAPGSFVTHYGKQIHYDGAKDQEVILQIVGQGPETATDAEEK